MKVIAFNGSPNKEGNTYYALSLIGEELLREGIGFEIVQVGSQSVRGCMACNKCLVNQDERCVICSDNVNDWIQKLKRADGVLLGSPTYYGGIAGTMKCFLDRAFYVTEFNQPLKTCMRHKVGAAVAAMGRYGGISVCDNLNFYFQQFQMIVPTADGSTVIFRSEPGAKKDTRGIEVMHVLGKNMAWLLKEVSKGNPCGRYAASLEGQPE